MRSRLPLLLAALLAFGCSNDGGNDTPDGAPTDAGGEMSTGDLTPDSPQTTTSSLTVTVYDVGQFGAPEDAKQNPLEGATVALDPPDGTRVEKTTDATGKVVFEDVVWTGGATAGVTTHKAGYDIYSEVGITGDTSEVDLYIFPLPTDMAEISLNLLNRDPTANYLIVTAWPGTYHEGGPVSVKLEVPKGQPFLLVAGQGKMNTTGIQRENDWDWFGWTYLDHTGVTADTTLDLDFSQNTLTPTAFTSSTKVPANTESPLNASSKALIKVSSGESGFSFFLGGANKSTLQGDTFSLQGEYVTPPGHTTLYTTHFLWLGPRWISAINAEGAPQDGATVDTYLDVPTVTQPASPTVAAPLHDPIEFALAPGETVDNTMVNLFTPNDELAWKIVGPGDATQLVIPQPPSSVTLTDLLGSEPFEAHVALCTDTQWKRLYCGRISTSRTFTLKHP